MENFVKERMQQMSKPHAPDPGRSQFHVWPYFSSILTCFVSGVEGFEVKSSGVKGLGVKGLGVEGLSSDEHLYVLDVRMCIHVHECM